MKYDFALDLCTDNANADIIARIEKESRVLEFGPANGRMTKYLYEEKKCCIDIVEIDEEAGKNAALYANKACIGERYGDINSIYWKEMLAGNKYDVIVFADVLEHLPNPIDIINKCGSFLSKNGKILCSIPNIAHASIILGLINGKFQYTDTGLLDKTHIHFFTEESFIEMARGAGYFISYEHAILGKVGTIEQPYSYEMVEKDVQRILTNRVNNEAYQYIFELKRDKENVEEIKDIIPRQVGIAKCYIREESDSDFCEQKCIFKYLNSQNLILEFDISNYINVEEVRLQLINANGIVRINWIEQTVRSGEFVNDYKVNGTWINENTICSLEDTVNISWRLGREEKSSGKIKISYDIIIYNSNIIKEFGYLFEELAASKREVSQMKTEVSQIENSISWKITYPLRKIGSIILNR